MCLVLGIKAESVQRRSTNELQLKGLAVRACQSMQHTPGLSSHLIFLLDGIYLHSQGSTDQSIIQEAEGDCVENNTMCNEQQSQQPTPAAATATS